MSIRLLGWMCCMIFLASCTQRSVRHDLYKPDIVINASDAKVFQVLTQFYREQGWEMTHKNTHTGKVSYGETATSHHFQGTTSDGDSVMVLVANRTNRPAEIKVNMHSSKREQQLAAIKYIQSLLKDDKRQLNPTYRVRLSV